MPIFGLVLVDRDTFLVFSVLINTDKFLYSNISFSSISLYREAKSKVTLFWSSSLR